MLGFSSPFSAASADGGEVDSLCAMVVFSSVADGVFVPDGSSESSSNANAFSNSTGSGPLGSPS